MNSIICILPFIALTLLPSGEALTKQECLVKVSRKTMKVYFKLYSECLKESNLMGKTGEEFLEKIGCVLKCVMKKDGLLNADDLVTEETVKKMATTNFQGEYLDKGVKLFQKCAQSHGGDKLKPNSPNCENYQYLGQCLQETIADICD